MIQLLKQQSLIEAWFREQFRLTPPPIYTSVDLRNAGFKISPVDTNVFPAGFNNLNSDFTSLYIQIAQSTLEQICPHVNKILIIPENHTRNLFYLENLAVLHDILSNAGFEVRIGSLLEDLQDEKEMLLPSGKKIHFEKLIRVENKIGVKDFFPCLILLNNDFSAGIPDILNNLDHQKMMPPLSMSWVQRLKSSHFSHYSNVTAEFSKLIQIDPWLITSLFRQCGEVNFMTGEGEDCLITHAQNLFEEVQKKYDEYHIEQKPFLVVKADAGTYGMAVMMVNDPKELKNLNRKQRTHMSKVKSGKTVNKVIIQEGVHTIETVKNKVAEPVIYTMGRCVLGGFYRVHATKKADENLNSPGSHFEPLPFKMPCNHPQHDKAADDVCNLFYVYGVIARLAVLAAAREIL